MKKILVIIALAVLTTACYGSKIEQLQKDKGNLAASLAQCQVEFASCEANKAFLSDQLSSCEFDRHMESGRAETVCDEFEHKVKNQFTATVIGVNDSQWRALPCDSTIQVQVRRLESGFVYLQYEVDGDRRYSDRLYFEGKHKDRNSLFVEDGVEHPILITVDRCPDGVCHVACIQMRTEHLSCWSDEEDGVMFE